MAFPWLEVVEPPARLLVVGGASLDLLHVAGVPTPSPGGAGLYTALAAARAGVDVTMLAPLPHPMPEALAPALDHIRWVGPAVAPEELPRFEIAYDEAGDVTLFREHLGAEPDMRPGLLELVDALPAGMPALAYCVPFLDAALQHSFVRALHDRGCVVAANTYLHGVRQHTDIVRDTFSLADVFFCNDAEAAVLFGPGVTPRTTAPHLLFVTRGASGALVCQGDGGTEVRSPVATVVDPTGAGDTFCGTVLASLAIGRHPVEAARLGCRAAAAEVTGVGPERLWEPLDLHDHDWRVQVDETQVDRMASLLADLPEVVASDFTGALFPDAGDERALDWFFAATLQQFGFWYDDGDRYTAPVVARLDGWDRKGSDYLWAAYQRWARRDPDAMTTPRQAGLTGAALAAALADDRGHQPLPVPVLALEAARAYGTSMVDAGWTPAELVGAANTSAHPTAALLRLLDHVGGYREDPLRKKSALLAVILRQRPEQWLRTVDGDDVPPIVDYHVQRTCLRTGMVTVTDAGLRARIEQRRFVDAAEEDAVRRAAFAAVGALATRSRRSMGAVDWFCFQMRHRCPEMTVPDCRLCPADPVCGHHLHLFQPVFRTTAY
jgi:ribokinase